MKYDLGQKSPMGCCAPSGCSEDEEKVHYPSLYFTGDEKMDIPDDGTAVITFRKVNSGENTRDEDDPKYSCEIEVHTLEIKDGASKAAKESGLVSFKDAFSKAAKKKLAEYDEEE